MKLIFFIMFIGLVIFVIGCKEVIIEPEATVNEEITNEDSMYMVSHSEYWSGEEGQIITRLLNYQGVPLVATCNVDIIYPNKTYFVQNESMTFNIESYYYSFTTPEEEGVYEYKATCTYASGTKTRSVMNSFHLSPALNFIQISHDNLTGQLVDLTDLNNAHFGNISYNLTQIKEDTDYIRNNLQTNASTDDILEELSSIQQFCDDSNTSSSTLCLWVNETRVRLINMNSTVDNYLQVINETVGVSQGIIVIINETVANIGQFGDNDRMMLEKIYNCTILGQGCFFNEERVWNYSGRYIHGETN